MGGLGTQIRDPSLLESGGRQRWLPGGNDIKLILETVVLSKSMKGQSCNMWDIQRQAFARGLREIE
jgi:hypothetical protein